MPTTYNGLLDQTHLEDVNLRSAIWKPVRAGRWSLDAVRPEFTLLRQNTPNAQKLRPTAWLDGLRGFAALLVYFHHNQLWSHGQKGSLVYENAFGYQGRYYFAALPFVRLFFSGGHFAVAIFFVISGYVLSLKSMGLIHRGQQASVADSLGSALFRRWLRLYIPVIIVTFIWLCFRHWSQMWVDLPHMQDTFRAEVVHWYQTFKNYSFVFSTDIYPFTTAYHFYLWSIPIEFKGSIIVYTALIALARCTRNSRLWCELGLMYYFLYIVDGWYGTLFVSGMLLCDLELLAKDDQLPRFLTALSGFKEMIFFHLFIFSLYLGGAPSFEAPDMDHAQLIAKSPGWAWLSYLKPQAVFDAKCFYITWAAIMAVAATPRLPWFKYFLETRLCQYLARISFALYLVHGPIIWTIADRMYTVVGLPHSAHNGPISGWVDKFPLSTRGPMGLELAFWVPQLILLPLTLYAAEIITKLVDEPSVKFANWLHRKTLPNTVPPKR
ncbi:hypothetical protein ACN47E_004632 [Coniothyrium glycines]